MKLHKKLFILALLFSLTLSAPIAQTFAIPGDGPIVYEDN